MIRAMDRGTGLQPKSVSYDRSFAGQVAQLVEHRTENPGVAGSIPALSTRWPCPLILVSSLLGLLR